MTRADFEQCLRSFFPLKEDEAIEALKKACEQESPGESVQYKNLFTEVRKLKKKAHLGPLVSILSEKVLLSTYFSGLIP